MRWHHPDPAYTASQRAGTNFLLAFRIALGFVIVIWSVFLFEQVFQLNLVRFGLRPRDFNGLIGVVTTPLLHYNLSHVASNTLPLLVGGTMLLFLFPNASLRVLPALYFGSGLLAWLFARSSIHIGASGLIYGRLTFVFASGVIRRDLRSIGAALLVWFLYGSMIWGVFPTAPNMSWELHASGALIGLLLAVRYRGWDQPPMKRYEWEDEPLADALDDAPWRDPRFDSRGESRFGSGADKPPDNRRDPDPWRLD